MENNFCSEDQFNNVEEWLSELTVSAIYMANDFWGKGLENPSEITVSGEDIKYESHRAVRVETIDHCDGTTTRWDFGNGVKVTFINIYGDMLEGIDEIADPEECELAEEVLCLDTSDPKYLKDVNKHLNEATRGNLFMWVSSDRALHITDLKQNRDFKNILKKKKLI